jgi:hypothetical protein
MDKVHKPSDSEFYKPSLKPFLEIREYGRRDPSLWPCGILSSKADTNFTNKQRLFGLCSLFGVLGHSFLVLI